MKTEFSFDKYVSQKPSFYHFLLSCLLDSKYKTWTFEFILKILAEIQLIALLLVYAFDMLSDQDNDNLGIFTDKIARSIIFDDILEFQSNSTLTNVLLIVIVIYILIMLLSFGLVTKFYVQKRSKNDLLTSIFVNICLVHSNIIFLFVYQYALSLIIEGSTGDLYILNYTGSGVYICLGVIILIPTVIFACLGSAYCYEPIKSGYKGGMRKGTLNFILIIYKITDPILDQAIDNANFRTWFRLGFMVILVSYRLSHCLSVFPYFYYQTMKVFLRFYFVELALVISNVLGILVNKGVDISGFTVMYIGIVFVVFFIKISDLVLQKTVANYSLKAANELKTKSQFYKKLFALEYILNRGVENRKVEDQKANKLISYLFLGIVKAHKNHCPNAKCGCTLILANNNEVPGTVGQYVLSSEETKTAIHAFLFEFMKQFIQDSTFILPSRSEIKVCLANFLFMNKADSYATAITLIHNSKLETKSTEWRVIGAELLKKIEEKILQKSESKIDVKELIDYYRLAGDMRSSIEGNISKFLGFWDTYNEPDPSLKKLCDISLTVNKEAEKIQAIWDIISTKYTRLSYQDYLLYGLYQSLVRSAPHSGEKALQRYFSLYSVFSGKQSRETTISKHNLHESANMIIYISMAKENLGEILFYTPNVETILGYSSLDISNKNVNVLMSQIFQENHQLILTAHIEKCRTSLFGSNRQVFTKKKSGYISPAFIYVSIFPYLQTHLLYVGILRPIKSFDEFILVLSNGDIDSFSETVGKNLNLNPNHKKKYNLKQICPHLERLHRAFNFMLSGQFRKLKRLQYSVKMNKKKISISTNILNKTNPRPATLPSLKDVVTIVANQRNLLVSPPIKEKPATSDRSSKHGKNEDPKKAEKMEKALPESSSDSGAESESESSSDETEDWQSLYEKFLSEGVPLNFKQHIGQSASEHNLVPGTFEYNTRIIEDNVYGTPLRIFKLQSLITDTDNDEDSSGGFEETYPSNNFSTASKGRKSDFKSGALTEEITEEDKSSRSSGDDVSLPRELGLPPMSPGSEKPLRFRNPFPENVLKEEESMDNIPKSPSKKKNIGPPVEGRKISFANFALERVESTGEKGGLGITTHSSNFELIHKAQKAVRRSLMLQRSFGKPKRSLESETHKGIETHKPPSNPKENLQIFFQEHKLMKAQNDELDRSSVSSAAMANQINSKIESAIYAKEKDIILSIMNVFVILFAIGCVVMMAAYLASTDTNLSSIKDNVEVLRAAYSRLSTTLELNRKAGLVMAMAIGIIPKTRHNVSDYTIVCLEDLGYLCSELDLYNNYVRNNLYKVQTELQARFYEPIRIVDAIAMNPMRQMNVFDASAEMANAGLRLYNMLPEEPSVDDINLFFIVSNTLNDLIVSNEEVKDILTADNDLSLKNIQQTNIILLVTVLVCAAVILAVIIRNEMVFIRRKNQFLDALLRLNRNAIDEIITLVRSFYTSLLESNRQDMFLDKITNQEVNNGNKELDEKRRVKNYKAKNANPKGLNSKIYINVALVSLFLGIFALMFCFLMIALSTYRGAINSSMDRIGDTYSSLVKLGLTFTSLYEYIATDGAHTIRNVPIKTEWESLYLQLTSLADYLNSFDDQDPQFNAEVRAILNNDLCPLLFADLPCYTDASGIASKGLDGMNGFMLSVLRTVKDYYDTSNHTFSEKTLALTMESFIEVETTYESYIITAFVKLDGLLGELLSSKINDFSYWLEVIMGITSALFLILLRWLWIPVLRRLKAERNEFRGILKLVPFNIIMTNKVLKNYLVMHSRDILGSLRNRI